MVDMDTWTEPARDLPVIGRPDVLVAGGGAAGIAAAIAAAREGAETWLVESTSMLGGLATFGLINLLLTLDDGAGRQVVGGLCQEFVDRLDARGAAIHPDSSEWNSEQEAAVDRWRRAGLIWGAPPEAVRYSVAFDPEAFVDVALELLDAHGVLVRLMTSCVAVENTGARITAVVMESKSGREVAQPHAVVDATGDADILHRAGVPTENTAVPTHSWFRVAGVDTSRRGGMWFETTSPSRVLVPFGPLPDRVDATDAAALSTAIIAGRVGARQMFDHLVASDPAFVAAWLDDHARFLGVTESRRLIGDHVLIKEDAGATFPDTVALTGHWTRRGVVYPIPFRSLTSPAAGNLTAAGRCISTSRYVHQATKEVPAAMATGEAAGVASAIAARAGLDVRDTDVAELRERLRQVGAIVERD